MTKTNPSTKLKKIAQIIVITITLIVVSPILLLIVIACWHYGPAGIIIVPIELKIIFEKSLNTYYFNQEIAPKITAQITDPNVRLELHSFEEVMMPQLYIMYTPNLEIRFHSVTVFGKDFVADKHPLLSVSVENLNTKKACGFSLHDKNYAFLQAKSSAMSDKLIDLYHHRQTIIDDFVAEKPECFLE